MGYSRELIDKIIASYKNKQTLAQIAKDVNLCGTTVSKLLKANGIMPSKRRYSNPKRYPPEKEKEIIEKYRKGATQAALGEEYHTSNTAIRRVLLRNNIIPRSPSKVQRLCKHNPFKKNDEYSDYFLGLLLTDGCIHKRSKADTYEVSLALTSTDDYIIKAFRDWASPKAKVIYVYQRLNGSYMCSISISNSEMVEWLRRKGNFYNKSFKAKIYSPITWNIMRGIFDGDGGFHKRNGDGLDAFVCGLSPVFMKQIQYFLNKEGIYSSIRYAKPDKWHKNGLYYVEICRYDQVIAFGKHLYNNAHIFLKRKYEKWLTFYENKKEKYDLNSGKATAS